MIKRIKIRDFKSIRELDLELDPVTVLVGRSGTGKSNLVQAIRFLRNVLINQEDAIRREAGWERIAPAGEQEPRTSIEVTFSVPGESREYNYRLAYSRHILAYEELSVGREIRFSRIRDERNLHWKWEKEPNLAAIPQNADTPMLGGFPSLQDVVFAYAALTTGVGFHHFPSSVLSGTTRSEGASTSGLLDNASNYREVMRQITQDFSRPDVRKTLLASVQAVSPGVISIELDSLTHPQRVLIAHHVAGKIFEFPFEMESDGLRRFYAHLLAVYQTPPKLTLVFEEPENAIFPGALSLLADEFKAAPRENRGQVILTTHNPILLDSFDVDSIRVVEMKDGKTIVGRIAKEQRQAVKERLLTTGELLTVETPRMENGSREKQAA